MIDEFDAKLLNLVQQDTRMTAEVLSEHVGLSASAVQRRLTTLKKQGYITHEVAVVSPAKVGRPLMLIIDVIVEREHPEDLQKFKLSMEQSPEIMQCYYVTGEKDFVLIAALRDVQHLEEFSQEFCKNNPNVKRFTSSVVVNPVKVSLAVTVEAT